MLSGWRHVLDELAGFCISHSGLIEFPITDDLAVFGIHREPDTDQRVIVSVVKTPPFRPVGLRRDWVDDVGVFRELGEELALVRIPVAIQERLLLGLGKLKQRRLVLGVDVAVIVHGRGDEAAGTWRRPKLQVFLGRLRSPDLVRLWGAARTRGECHPAVRGEVPVRDQLCLVRRAHKRIFQGTVPDIAGIRRKSNARPSIGKRGARSRAKVTDLQGREVGGFIEPDPIKFIALVFVDVVIQVHMTKAQVRLLAVRPDLLELPGIVLRLVRGDVGRDQGAGVANDLGQFRECATENDSGCARLFHTDRDGFVQQGERLTAASSTTQKPFIGRAGMGNLLLVLGNVQCHSELPLKHLPDEFRHVG